METRRSRTMQQQKNKPKSSVFRVINWVLFLAILALSTLIVYYFITYRLFNFKRIPLMVYSVIGMIVFITFLWNFLKKAPKTLTFLSIVYIGLASYGFYTIHHLVSGFTALQQTTKYTEQTMSVVVRNTSEITTLAQLNNKVVDAPVETDATNVEAIVNDAKEKENVVLKVNNVESYMTAYKKLMDGDVEAIILNSTFEDLLEQEVSDYTTHIRRVYEYVVKTEQVQEPVEVVTPTEQEDGSLAFNIYISGIDTFGPISSVSRSDVNIIMSVNTKTGKILLTTTPRDAYVRIAGRGNNQYDKLTHAGIYGVQASINTLENLYDTTLNYYARINFTSFMNLIDLVGGVEVYNSQTFTSRYKGYYFPQGSVYLTSDKALAFVRERYSLTNGDVDRARNQQKVIEAIVKKLASPVMLTKAGDIMGQLLQSMQTNMPFEILMSMINQKLSDNKEISVESQALSVTGQTGLPSYAMPGYNLYMGVVNQSSLQQVAAKIQSVLEP